MSVAPIITGLWQLADQERRGAAPPLDQRAEAMLPYVDAGLATFDAADHYGAAEVVTGRFRELHPGRPIQVLTKWVPPPGPLTRVQVREAIDRARERLGVPRVDLLQFHAWRYSHPSWLDGLWWLDEARNDGLVAHIGLTNVDTAHLRIATASGLPIVTNQICYSLLDVRPRKRMAAFCVEHDVGLLAYGTLAGGFLSERWLDQAPPDGDGLPTWSLMKYRRFIEAAGGWSRFQALLSTIKTVADRLGSTVPAVACRWVLDQPAVTAVIIGARLGEREHVAATLDALRLRLDDRARSDLEAAVASLDPIPGEPGDEYRHPPLLTATGDLSHHVKEFPPPFDRRSGADGRDRVWSGTSSEELASYCRAIRHGDRILVSGTTASHGDRCVGGADPEAQTHAIVDKIEGALESLGGTLAGVVRTRVYLSVPQHWEAVSRALGERFRGIDPANTLVAAGLVGQDYLVEIEAEAVASAGQRSSE